MDKTLLITENFPPKIGGSSRYLWEIYSRFDADRFVIAAGQQSEAEAFDRTHRMCVNRVPLTLNTWGILNYSGARGYWRAKSELQRIFQHHTITRIHCGRCLPEGLLGWMLRRRFGTPYICYVYGEEMNYAAGSRELTRLMRCVLAGAEYVVAISRNTERIIVEEWGLAGDRIQLLFPGVNTTQFVPADHDPALRTERRWHNRLVVLTTGRLQKRKGHDQMIRALQSVRKVVPNILYAIVGDGEERSYLEGLVKQEQLDEYVQFWGERDEAWSIQSYQQCDLFALPNRQVGQDIEGFGMVLLEAQACGKPVIAGMSGGTAETMKTPDTGLTIPCETPEPIANAVIELLQDEPRRKQMGKAARNWVVANFDWEGLSNQAAAIFGFTSLPRTVV